MVLKKGSKKQKLKYTKKKSINFADLQPISIFNFDALPTDAICNILARCGSSSFQVCKRWESFLDINNMIIYMDEPNITELYYCVYHSQTTPSINTANFIYRNIPGNLYVKLFLCTYHPDKWKNMRLPVFREILNYYDVKKVNGYYYEAEVKKFMNTIINRGIYVFSIIIKMPEIKCFVGTRSLHLNVNDIYSLIKDSSQLPLLEKTIRLLNDSQKISNSKPTIEILMSLNVSADIIASLVCSPSIVHQYNYYNYKDIVLYQDKYNKLKGMIKRRNNNYNYKNYICGEIDNIRAKSGKDKIDWYTLLNDVSH
jgi:hypothetical protein